MVFFPGLPVASLQSNGQGVLTLLGRLVSGAQTWVRASVPCQPPVLVVTGIAGAIGLMFVYSILLLIRARRETREFREELVKLVAQRQAAESANEANANLLAGMIPLIRKPINAILDFANLALKTDLDPALRAHLDTVRTSADWLSHIANDTRELSRIEAGKLQLSDVPFSISECLLFAMKLMEPEASARKLVTACKIDPQLPEVVCGDPTRLRYLIFNLLDYAVSFSASGNIILSAAFESDSADDVLVRVAVTGTDVEIPPAERLLTLEPFGQVDAGVALKSDPTDLGLVISRRLVDLMGGSMESQSQLGLGNTFEFTVRFRKQKTAEAGSPVHAPQSIGLRALSVLVAEDNSLNRRLTTKALESAGHRVWVAANSKEVAHNVQTEGFDLILMDLEMPDSLEATRAIRAAEAPGLHIPIYALTTHALPNDRNRWVGAGIDDFIAKPIVVDEVLQLVSKLARQPSGAWSTQSENRQASAQALPGDYLEAADTANTSGADFLLDLGDKALIPGANDWLMPTECGIPNVNGNAGATAPSVWIADLNDIAVEPTDNDYTPKYVEQQITAPNDVVGRATDNGDKAHISDADASSSTDFLHDEEARSLDLSPYLLGGVAGAETNGFSGATRPALNAEIDEACVMAIDGAGTLAIPDSDETVLREVNQGAEIASCLPGTAGIEASYDNSDDSGPPANAQLSVPAGLALLEATYQRTPQAASLVKQDDGPTPSADRDPFEQARKSLSNSRFGVRVIHNDGDPSDRNLI